MRRTARWATRPVLVTVALLLATHSIQAQTVVVQVLGTEASQPLRGAVAYLVAPSGEVVASRLSDRNGRALFAGIQAGRYRVRADMLGRDTGESDVFGVVDGGSVPIVLRLPPHAIEISGLEVTAADRSCEIRPAEEGRLLAAVWEEVRKSLSAAAITDQQGTYRYALLTYVRQLDSRGEVLDEDQTRMQGFQRTAFASHAIEDLVDQGFAHESGSLWTFYGPDAGALLSDAFLDTHCFRLVEGESQEAGLLGLAFEPTGENDEVVDISGTLWLDRESVELRRIDYTYLNLEPQMQRGEATGHVEFRRISDGTWIVPEWWIRTPVVDVQRSTRRAQRRAPTSLGPVDAEPIVQRRRVVVGFTQTGGRVEEVLSVGGRELATGVAAGAIEGLVVDSLGVPIQGVGVRAAGSNQTLFTNPDGRFRMVNLLEGSYRLRFVDPGLEALGLEPPEATRDVLPGMMSSLEFVMPTPAEVLRASCGDGAKPGTSALSGVLRDAGSDAPISGASVQVRWTSSEPDSAETASVGADAYRELRTSTNELGVYRFCDVPREERLDLAASVDGMDGASQDLRLSADEQARMQLLRFVPVAPSLADDAGLVGRTRDAASEDLLDETLVEVPALDVQVVSDALGRVVLGDLPPGEYLIRATRLGYVPTVSTIQLPGTGREFRVGLDPMAAIDAAEPGTILGQVTDERGRSVSDVDVRVVGQPQIRTSSNPQGRFGIGGVSAGLLEVRFEKLGQASRTARFVMQPGQTVDLGVEMPVQAIELEPITVSVRSEFLERWGFYRRQRIGFGHHRTAAEFERFAPFDVADVLRRIPGIRVNEVPQRPGEFVVVNPRVNTSALGQCLVPVYLDGLPMHTANVNVTEVFWLDAVEVYLGVETPMQYQMLNPCGAVLLWTRR